MNSPDIRWKQRFQNYVKALQTLTEAIELAHKRPLSRLEKQGLIKARNLMHTYNQEMAENIEQDTLARFYPAFVALAERFSMLHRQQDTE